MKIIYPFLGLLLFCAASSQAQSWQAVDTGVNSSVDVLNEYNGQLVAAGRYSALSKWNGSVWADFTPDGSPPATAILVEGDNLFCGGQFTGGDANKVIRQFDGSVWSTVGGNVSAYTNVDWNTNYRWSSIFMLNNQLHAIYNGGLMRFEIATQTFVAAGDQVADFGEPVAALTYGGVIENKAYFYGYLGNIPRLITLENSTYDTLNYSNYPYRYITGAKVLNDELYVSGWFATADIDITGFLKFSGQPLAEVGDFSSSVVEEQRLYATPNHLFGVYYVDNVVHVGEWNGSSFSELGSGATISGGLDAVWKTNGVVYAGGFFTAIDGVTVNNIAQFAGGVGLDELAESVSFMVYPNPAQTYTDLLVEQSVRMISIFDLAGKLIATRQLLPGEFRMDLSVIPAGAYSLVVSDGLTIRSTRLVVR